MPKSPPPEGFHDATFWVQIEPTWSSYRRTADGDRLPDGAKAVGITQKRPASPKRGTIMAKLTVRVPDGAFMPLRPEAIVVIPESMTITNPIEVEAREPVD